MHGKLISTSVMTTTSLAAVATSSGDGRCTRCRSQTKVLAGSSGCKSTLALKPLFGAEVAFSEATTTWFNWPLNTVYRFWNGRVEGSLAQDTVNHAAETATLTCSRQTDRQEEASTTMSVNWNETLRDDLPVDATKTINKPHSLKLSEIPQLLTLSSTCAHFSFHPSLKWKHDGDWLSQLPMKQALTASTNHGNLDA